MCACGALALLTLPRASSVEYVRRPISDGDLAIADTRISGTFPQGLLPAYHLHWDGQPPQAFLVDARTDQVLAPSALSEATLKLNQNAVLWTPTTCTFAMSPALYAATGEHLAVKFEVPGPRRVFYFSFVFGLVLFLFTLLTHFGHSLLFIRTGRRLEGFVGYAQTVFFFVAATMVLVMLFPGYPVNGPLNSGSDESNLNSFAAALDRPEIFARDKLLSQRSNFDWYTPLYVEWVRLFQWIGFRYDTNRSFVLFLSTLIGLCGYQRLFGTLSDSSWFGFIAAVCLWFLKATYPPNESWSAVFAAPRTAYTALLPWAVLFATSYLDRPTRWWLPASVSGFLFYVHPVSSPALTAAVLTGFLLAGRERLRTRCAHVLIAATGAVAVMLPYMLVYASKYSGARVPDAEIGTKVLNYATQRFAPGYIDLSIFYSQVRALLIQNYRYWLGAAAIVLLVPLYRRSSCVRFFYGTLAGFCIVTFLLPFIDLTIAKRLRTLPFQVDLIRNIRYLDVLLLSTIALLVGEYRRLWERQAADGRNEGRWRRLRLMRTVWGNGIALIGMLAVFYSYRGLLHPSVRLMILSARASIGALQGQHNKVVLSNMELINALHALRRSTETVFGPLHFRQMYIPLVFVYKDLGALSYANPAGLVEAREALDQIAPHLKPPVDLLDATQVARIMDAQIVVLYNPTVDPSVFESNAVIFRNQRGVVLRIPESGGA